MVTIMTKFRKIWKDVKPLCVFSEMNILKEVVMNQILIDNFSQGDLEINRNGLLLSALLTLGHIAKPV